MLKKSDLVKQFDLVVKQEITNHNEQILSSNVRVNELEKKIEQTTQKFSQDLAQISSSLGAIKSEHSAIFEGHRTFSQKVMGLVGDLDKSIVAVKTKFSEFCKSQEGKHVIQDDFFTFIKTIEDRFKDVGKTTNEIKEEIKWVSTRLQDQVISLIERFREEIKIRPSEIVAMEKTLLKRIEELRIDNDGLIRELKICKRANLINEKKIENLYTLVDRIKNQATEGGER
jgi:hypothetical protein